VEQWLAQVEFAMQVSVRDGCLEASELATSWANGEVPTTYAVRMLSAQHVVVALQVAWTQSIGTAIALAERGARSVLTEAGR